MPGLMNRLTLIALTLTLALPAAACKKDKKAAPAEGTATAPTAAPEAEKPGGETAAPAQPEKSEPTMPDVRTPAPEDLSTYTSDLPGDGPLMATIETSLGVIHCELFDKGAPITVANFIGLARGMHPFKDPKSGKVETRPYYDGTVFHRVIPEFMIQGGDPTATGNGGPGYEFQTEVSPDLKHEAGTLSMANAGPNTNGSQFFITEGAIDRLDGKYNVFGRCKDLDVVKKIARVETTVQPDDPNQEKSRPVQEVKLVKVTIAGGEAAAGAKKDSKKGAKKDDAKKDEAKDEK